MRVSVDSPTVTPAGVLALVTLALAALLLAPGCSPSGPTEESPQGSSADVGSELIGGEKALEPFWEATRKTGSYEVRVTDPNGDPYDSKATFTFDGQVFRIDYEADSASGARSIISTDGASVWIVLHDTRKVSRSQTPPPYYVSLFSRPDADLEDQGVDAETGAQKYYFLMEETYAVGSDSKPWYEKDRTYLVTEDKLVGLVTRGGPESSAESGEFFVHEFDFGEVSLNPEIDETTFEIPYPIGE